MQILKIILYLPPPPGLFLARSILFDFGFIPNVLGFDDSCFRSVEGKSFLRGGLKGLEFLRVFFRKSGFINICFRPNFLLFLIVLLRLVCLPESLQVFGL